MKLLLTSSGLTTPEIIQACVALCAKPQDQIKVAAISEAYAVEQGDKRWVINELNDITKNFPAEFDLINLLALMPEQIQSRASAADVIFVLGGHTDYLMHVFEKSGFTKLLPKLLKNKIYVGSSAGSMVLCKRVSTEAYQKVYGEVGTYGVTRYMELVDFAIKPHLDSELFPKNRKEVLLEISKDYDGTIYGLKDSQAIVIEDEAMGFVGGEPFCARNGEVL
jgi:dipeptidase E